MEKSKAAFRIFFRPIFQPMLLRAFASRGKPLLAFLFLLSLLIGAMEGLFILIAKSAVTGARWGTWSIPLILLSAIVTLRTLAQILSARIELRGLFAWVESQRSRLLQAVSGREFPAYRDPWRSRLVTSLGDGMEDVTQGIGAGFRCLAALAHILALAPILFLFSWKLAAGAMALAVPALLASRLRAGMLAASGRRWNESKARLALDAEEFAEGLEAEAGNGGLEAAAARMGFASERHARHSRSWESAKAVFPPALEWFFFMALAALALALGAAGIPNAGVPESGAVVVTGGGIGGAGPVPAPMGILPFVGLLLLLYRPIREWARFYPIHVLGNRAWEAFLDLQGVLESFPPRAPRPASPSGAILLEGIRFGYHAGYPGDPPAAERPERERMVLAGLDLEIDPGELTWISGRNGAGKTTLLKLLAGIESPQAGAIQVPSAWKGRALAYLPQKPFLGSDWKDWARGYAAADPDAWKALDGILGLERILAKAGDDPKGLSGGERQRLCLARAFASDAPYLLLDEPTTWLTASDREAILGDLLEFWRRPVPGMGARGAALVSHEPFLGEFCSRTLRLAPEAAGVAGKAGGAG
jgi:ABC-type multidrug transport system fused ATPase/permease subunit